MLNAARTLLVLIALSLSACFSVGPRNPAITLTDDEVDAEWRALRSSPGSIERPVVVLGGWRSPSFTADGLRANLTRATGAPPERFLSHSYPFITDIEAAATEVVERIEDAWPSDDPERTVEVDVVAISMGGLVARAAQQPARPDAPARKRLVIRRLFTLGTPHRGARMAAVIAPDRAAADMKPGSPFLARLDEVLVDAPFELLPYTVLNDKMVGATNTAPHGWPIYWNRGTFLFSHYRVSSNRAILVDIARRLRGEDSIFEGPSTPPCD